MRQFKPGQLQSGSLYNISASYAVTASYALNSSTGGSTFPFTGSARITGSLGVTGSISTTTGFLHNQSLDSANRTVYDSLGVDSIQWGNRILTTNNGSVLDWSDNSNTTGITTIPISERFSQQRINDQLAAQTLIANGKIVTEQTIDVNAQLNGTIVYYNGDVAEWQRLASSIITNPQSLIDNILGIVIDSDHGTILLQGTITIQVDNGTSTIGFPTITGAIIDGEPLYLTINSADTESIALSIDMPTGAVRSMGHILQSVTNGGLTNGIISFNPSADYSRILSGTSKIYQINGKDIYAISSSLSTSSSFAIISATSTSSSFSSFSTSASYAVNSSFATSASFASTASFVQTSQTASYVTGSIFTNTNPALSASYASTSSFIQSKTVFNQSVLGTGNIGFVTRSFDQSIGSNATGETQLLQITIPANTFSATDKLAFFAIFSKTGTAHNTTHRIKISTSASMPVGTASQIAQYASTNTLLFTKINRELTISGGVLKGHPFTTSAVTDSAVSTTAISSVAFDVTQTQYVYVSATPNATTTDVTRLEAFEIRNI